MCNFGGIFRDSFLVDFQMHIVEEFQEKCRFIKFQKVRLNPEINRAFKWKIINQSFYQKINKKLKLQNPMLTFINSSKQKQQIFDDQLKQLQIVFCSKNRSDAFIGYIPFKANLASFIRQIQYQMGFVEMEKSRIIFLEKSPQRNYKFFEIQKFTVGNCPDNQIMVFNLQRFNDEEQNLPCFGGNNNSLNLSNEAVVGDQNTMEDESRENEPLNQRVQDQTLSTGDKTPFSFAMSQGFDLDRQYRMNQLFGAKEPEEIEKMKGIASQIICNQEQLIPVSKEKQLKDYELELEKLAEQALDQIVKKKNFKEKEKQFSLGEI